MTLNTRYIFQIWFLKCKWSLSCSRRFASAGKASTVDLFLFVWCDVLGRPFGSPAPYRTLIRYCLHLQISHTGVCGIGDAYDVRYWDVQWFPTFSCYIMLTPHSSSPTLMREPYCDALRFHIAVVVALYFACRPRRVARVKAGGLHVAVRFVLSWYLSGWRYSFVHLSLSNRFDQDPQHLTYSSWVYLE